jgi:predicted Rossmann fold flavoprotein
MRTMTPWCHTISYDAVYRIHDRVYGRCRHQSRIYSSKVPTGKVGIFGAGAAGLTAAYFAATGGSDVVLYEKTRESGNKIRISGGSRCNILPGSLSIEDDFFTESKIGCLKTIFGQWTLQECTSWLENDLGIELKYEEETNKIFPVSDSGKHVRDILLEGCVKTGNVQVVYSKDLSMIEHVDSGQYTCTFSDGSHVVHDTIILATGGLSFPAMGTTGAGYAILSENLGHTLRDPYPALTPLKGTIPGKGYELSGVSLSTADVSAAVKKQSPQAGANRKRKVSQMVHSKRNDILFTHRGYSGPSILDISHYYTMAMQRDSMQVPEMSVSWNGSITEHAWRDALEARSDGAKVKVSSLLRKFGTIPARLAKALCEESGIPEDRILAELRKEEKTALLHHLVRYPLHIHGDEGYPKAEVTGGGVKLEELDCATMESRLHKNLYVIGELCDVHGRIGGFNFLFSWYSGRLAGRHASSSHQNK